MIEERVSISKFLENPAENVNECSNFYDWFCSDESLPKRMLKLVPKLKFMVDQGIIDAENSYVWFKNNCPMCGSTYDDIRINALNEAEDYLGGFAPSSGHLKGKGECDVWTLKGKFNNRTFVNWSAFKKEVKENKNFRNELTESFKVR